MSSLSMTEQRLMKQLSSQSLKVALLNGKRYNAALELIDNGLAVFTYQIEDGEEIRMLGATQSGIRLLQSGV